VSSAAKLTLVLISPRITFAQVALIPIKTTYSSYCVPICALLNRETPDSYAPLRPSATCDRILWQEGSERVSGGGGAPTGPAADHHDGRVPQVRLGERLIVKPTSWYLRRLRKAIAARLILPTTRDLYQEPSFTLYGFPAAVLQAFADPRSS
jgi:hypothetical protein